MLRFLALWLLVRALGGLPPRVLYAAADAAAVALWYASAGVRRTTRDHMRHVLSDGPESDRAAVERAARGCVRSTARRYADFARTPHMPREDAFAELEEIEGIERFFEAYDRGCGVILVSAHLGSPEYLFRAASFLGFDMLVVTERLSPPRLHEFVHAVRAAPGVRFVPAELGGVREMLARLRGGGVVAVLGDRDIQRNGVTVPFFGERTSLPSGALELARRTRATLIPVFGLRSGVARYRIAFHAPVEVPRGGDREADLHQGMRALARALEEGIRRAPDQWFVLQPIWSGLPRSSGGERTMSSRRGTRKR